MDICDTLAFCQIGLWTHSILHQASGRPVCRLFSVQELQFSQLTSSCKQTYCVTACEGLQCIQSLKYIFVQRACKLANVNIPCPVMCTGLPMQWTGQLLAKVENKDQNICVVSCDDYGYVSFFCSMLGTNKQPPLLLSLGFGF